MDDEVRLTRVDADPPHLVWELCTSTETVGYLQALDGDTLWISHIGVDPRYRRQGHATRLLLAALTYAPDVPIALAAAPFPSWKEPGLAHDNLRAWYARHGFRPAPRPEDPYYMLLQR
ncbi:GNAT family N-acetyltransferase [Streptomyces cinereoruber]